MQTRKQQYREIDIGKIKKLLQFQLIPKSCLNFSTQVRNALWNKCTKQIKTFHITFTSTQGGEEWKGKACGKCGWHVCRVNQNEALHNPAKGQQSRDIIVGLIMANSLAGSAHKERKTSQKQLAKS